MTLRPSLRRALTLAAAVLALMLLVGPVLANALTTGPGLLRTTSGDGFALGGDERDLVVLHNELIGTDPTDGARLDTGPARVTLIFDLPAQRGFSTIIVTGPDGNQWQAGPATEDGTTVSAPVRPLGPAGDYTVAWRIISVDGHPLSATLRFTLTTPGPGTAAAPPPSDAIPATDPGSAGAVVWWPWAAGAGALLGVGVVLALRTCR